MQTMIRGRDNAADSLDDVVEIIRALGQTGLLRVERSQGGRLEVAEVYFQGGRPIYARAGQMVGQPALAWLMSWRLVRFAFFTDQPAPPPNIEMPVLPSTGNYYATDAQFSTARFPQSNTYAGFGGMNTGGMEQVPVRTSPLPPTLELLVPQKIASDRDVLSLPLTRPQRLIYLLIDGKRAIADISRCTRKSVQEIERLLIELRERGLINV